jgi:hypothetical protein
VRSSYDKVSFHSSKTGEDISYSKRRKSIGADLEAAFVDPLEEIPEDTLAALLLIDINIAQLNSFLSRLALIIQYDGSNGVVL